MSRLQKRGASVVAVALAALLGAGCGGDEERAAETQTETGQRVTVPPGSLGARLVQRPGANVGLNFATSDFAIGENRVAFAVIRPTGELVRAPRARIFTARSPAGKATFVGVARLLPMGVHQDVGATELYVIRAQFLGPGDHYLLAEPVGERIQGASKISVGEQTKSPPIGSKAFPSDNPTLGDAPAATITTANPPDRDLLRYSIKDSLAAGAPFVVTFATPKFCQSRTCGPTVQIVQRLRRRFSRAGVRFIHVEVYESNDPQRGVNQWMREWELPTEPWVFVVDGQGIIREKFEGAVSVVELEQAVRKHLLAG